MPATETTRLLPSHQNGNRNGDHDGMPPSSLGSRFSTFFKGEGEPSWLASYKWFFFGSYFNIFLVFVPLCVVGHHLNWDVALRFSFSFLAIIPLAKVRLIARFCASIILRYAFSSMLSNFYILIAAGRFNRTAFFSTWSNPRWIAQRVIRKCCRNHRRYRRIVAK